MLNRLLAAALVLLPPVAAAQPAAYAGQQSRDIKALSAEEVDDLLHGRGMGLARAAELNGYPGPAHALDLAEKLGLDAAQTAALRAAKEKMSAAAVALGSALVERERALDRLFAARHIEPAALDRLTAEIGSLQGRLRAVHLAAHLEIRAVLREDQVAAYDRERGYGGAAGEDGKRHH